MALLPVRVWGGWSACSPVLCPEECSSSLACPSPSNLRNFLAAGRCGIQVAPSLEGKAEFVATPESGSVVPTHTLPAAPAAACPRHPPGGPMPVKKKKKCEQEPGTLSSFSRSRTSRQKRSPWRRGRDRGDGPWRRLGPAPRTCTQVRSCPPSDTHTPSSCTLIGVVEGGGSVCRMGNGQEDPHSPVRTLRSHLSTSFAP